MLDDEGMNITLEEAAEIVDFLKGSKSIFSFRGRTINK